jgi:hypothetical protein
MSKATTPPRTIQKIGVIIPTASTSKTNQRDIDRHISQMLAKAAKAGQDRGIEYEIHVTGNRTGNHTIRNRAGNFNNLRTVTHTPNFKNASSRKAKANEVHRTNGRLAAIVDALIVITGNRDSLTNMDREIIANASKRGKIIKTQKIIVAPTPEDQIPEKAPFRLPASEYRVNLRNYRHIDDLLADHCTHGLDDGQKPIYCGAPNKKTDDKGSPLANKFRNTANWQELYRSWLWQEMKAGNEEILSELRKIDRTTPLICYCHDRKPCHTDIIRKAANWLRRKAVHAKKTGKIIFISGHRDITEEEFKEHYKERIIEETKDPSTSFVVGDAAGVDNLAQIILTVYAPDRHTVYFKGETPRHIHAAEAKEKGGYSSQIAKDTAMTNASTHDLLWIRPGKERSGTASNQKRREAVLEKSITLGLQS